MSYAREDRARIFEHAMIDGDEALFQSELLQKKLAAICLAIRAVYGDAAYPWEQYLNLFLSTRKNTAGGRKCLRLCRFLIAYAFFFASLKSAHKRSRAFLSQMRSRAVPARVFAP